MPQAAKGLYAPRIVDSTFAIMGLGSALLLANGQSLAIPQTDAPISTFTSGLVLLATVILIGLSSCMMHRFDRRGWDDYMGQIVSQSAMIGMVTLLLCGVAIDFVLNPAMRISHPASMVQGMVPIAACSWALGYFFLRWRGTSA